MYISMSRTEVPFGARGRRLRKYTRRGGLRLVVVLRQTQGTRALCLADSSDYLLSLVFHELYTYFYMDVYTAHGPHLYAKCALLASN